MNKLKQTSGQTLIESLVALMAIIFMVAVILKTTALLFLHTIAESMLEENLICRTYQSSQQCDHKLRQAFARIPSITVSSLNYEKYHHLQKATLTLRGPFLIKMTLQRELSWKGRGSP